MNLAKKFLAWAFAALLLALLAFGGLVAWLWITDYRPPQIVALEVQGKGENAAPEEMSLLSWNIGYAGLGAEQDFFPGRRQPRLALARGR